MAALLSTKLFKVELADPSCSASRAARRVVINTEILRASRVAAGDVVRVTASEDDGASVSTEFDTHPKFISFLMRSAFFFLGRDDTVCGRNSVAVFGVGPDQSVAVFL